MTDDRRTSRKRRTRPQAVLGAFWALGAVTLIAGPAPAQVFTIGGGGAAPDPSIEGAPLTETLGETLGIGRGGADGPATLEADDIVYVPETETVRAEGNVQVFYGGRVLQADRIVYDAKNDLITAEGEIRVVNPDGSVIIADEASFDSEIRDGLVKGARAVLADGQARIAAVEGQRVDGRYTALSKAVYSPCEVCRESPNPLWGIRARRVIQDEVARDIIYEDATFEIAGVPVAYLPYFRHADPSVKRRSGFLTPEFKSSNALGYALKTPYYYAFSPNRDVTITPFIASDELPVLEGEYRAWDSFGKYSLGGSITHSADEFAEGTRGHFIGNGKFGLPMGFTAGYDSLIASDDTYLRRYDFDGRDRAETRLYVERYGETGFLSLEGIRPQSFREGEFAGELPRVLPSLEAEQVWDAPMIGGEVALAGEFLQLDRTNGRDVRRIIGEASWRRLMVSDTGVVFDLIGSTRGDLYQVEDDAAFDEGFEGRVLPLAALTTSLPLGRLTENASHVIEPIAQVVWTPYGGNSSEIPNEDSQDAELDDLSVFALNRFPGKDRWEEGPRATLGVRYLREGDGADVEVTLGQSYRLRESDAFSDQSGLDGVASDVVGAWTISDDAFRFGHRFRVSDGFNFQRNEVFGRVELFDRLELGGGYVFLDADPAAGSDEDRAEGFADASLGLTETWTLLGNVRHDFEQERFVTAGGGLRYGDECVEIDFSVGRRFNSVEDAPASTNFGLAVRLKTLADN